MHSRADLHTGSDCQIVFFSSSSNLNDGYFTPAISSADLLLTRKMALGEIQGGLRKPTCDDSVRSLLDASLKRGCNVLTYLRATEINIFEACTNSAPSEDNDPPSTTTLVHPCASPEVHTLSAAQLELILYETRGHNGCFKALALYQKFFELCPPGQKVSIQITNGVGD